MAAPTFLEILRSEVARMQALAPTREGEFARAHALILNGQVLPTDDPETARVLSSDGHKMYTVNGVCDCQAGQHGKPCKHRQAWLLYQHIAKKVKAQPDHGENCHRETPLPEAPASCNVRVLIAGHEVQWTLRGHAEAEVFARLAALLGRADVRPLPKPVPRTGNWKQSSRGR